MRIFVLAGRNLTRNWRRTLITLAAIAVGLGLMLMTVNLGKGQYQAAIRAGISSLAGHVVVQAEGYQDEREDLQIVPDSAAVEAAIVTAVPEATVARRMVLGGLLVSSTSSVSAGLQGVEPIDEAEVNTFADKVVAGTWLEDDETRGIVIGVGMAKTLDVELGDKLVYMGQHGGEEMASRLFRVKGIFKTGGIELDSFVAFAHLKATQEVLGKGDAAHLVTVHIPDAKLSVATRDRVQKVVPADLDVRSWQQALPEIYGLIQMDRRWNDIMLGILGLIVAMGVLNTVLMSVLERTREFGVMLAVGMKPRQIATLVLYEGFVLGVLGTLLGVGIGLALSYPLVTTGLDYTQYMGESMEWGGVTVSAIIKAEYDPPRMAQYAVAAVIVTVLAAVYPAYYVSKFTPVDAMRHH